MAQDYRLKITGTYPEGNRPFRVYFTRKKDITTLMDHDETPLTLSKLIHEDAAAMRFILEDAPNGPAAATALRERITGQFKSVEPGSLPVVVEVITAVAPLTKAAAPAAKPKSKGKSKK